MLRGIHKLAACAAAVCLLCGMAANTSAGPAPAKTDKMYGLATVTSGDRTIEIPVVTHQTMQPPPCQTALHRRRSRFLSRT